MIRVQSEDFSIQEEIDRLKKNRTDIGAIVTFTGTVRDDKHSSDNETALRSLTLEHYPGMTQAELERIKHEAENRWPLQACLVIHRFGKLYPGDNIVLVITMSAHRQAAFDAANFLMDYLKNDAPFWKSEETEKGDRNWVEAKSSDEEAQNRWQKDQ